MTVQELLNWCTSNSVPLDTHIVLSDKDEFLLVEENVRFDDNAYFGNCRNGTALLNKIAPLDEETGERENQPKFLLLGTGY